MILAARGDLDPESKDNGFQIHRNTGLCDLGFTSPKLGLEISLTSMSEAHAH